jgi:hypothetical protein
VHDVDDAAVVLATLVVGSAVFTALCFFDFGLS